MYTTNYDELTHWMDALRSRALSGEQVAKDLYLKTLQQYVPSFERIVGNGGLCDQQTLLNLTVKRFQYERYSADHR